MSMAKSIKNTSTFSSLTLHSNTNFLSDTSLNYIRYFFCIIIAYSFSFLKNAQNVRKRILYKLFLMSNVRHSYRLSRLNRILQSLFLWICIMNFLLISIVNSSIINPGPARTKNHTSFSV